MKQLLNSICSHVNKQANAKQRWVPSWCGLKAQVEDTVVQGPRLAAEGGVRRGCEGHQKRAPPNIKAHVGRWGAGPRSASWQRSISAHVNFWWEVNIPGYHRETPSASYPTLLYGEVAGLWGSRRQRRLPVLTPNDMVWGPSSARGVMKRMQLWFVSQNYVSSSGPWTHHFFWASVSLSIKSG